MKIAILHLFLKYFLLDINNFLDLLFFRRLFMKLDFEKYLAIKKADKSQRVDEKKIIKNNGINSFIFLLFAHASSIKNITQIGKTPNCTKNGIIKKNI